MSQNPQTRTAEAESKPALVPKLRFPEFQLKEGWHDAPIETLLEVRDERQPPTEKAPLYSLTIEDGVTPKSDRYNREFLVRDAANKKYKLVRPDDIVYNPSNLRWGAINFSRLNHEVVVSPIYEVLFVRDRSKLCFEFVAYAVMRDEQIRRFITKAQGTLVERIAVKIEDFIETGLHTPSILAEQQKIAECLSSVDGLMAAQARKVDALKTHKKGLMQQLFPREGETQPRLRFPEFQNAGEWGEGRLADIATVLQGYGFPERHQGQTSGDYPFYKVSDISRSLAAGKLFIEESANYVNESLLKELRAKPIPEGTTIFAKIGEAIRSNKRAITTVPCLIDNNAAGVKRIKGRSTDFFIYLLMEQISLIDHAGGVVPAVNKSAIEEISVRFPEPAEQERIASCLASLDALITGETQKLETLKTHKRGLMQQLFPSPEEATP